MPTKQKKFDKPVLDMSGVAGVITQQSHQHAIEVVVPQMTLEAKFSDYWKKVKDILPPNIVKAATKGGFREITRKRAVQAAGGKQVFFAPVLADVINAYLDTQPRQALIIMNVELVEREDLKYVVRALVSMEPEVKWKKLPGIDEPIVVKVPKQPEGWLDAIVEEQVKRGQQDAVILTPVVDDTVAAAEGHVAVIDCQSLIDGKPWEPGQITAKKWPVDKMYFKQPELYDALVNMKPGESRTVQFILNDNFGEDKGRTVEATLKLNQLYTKRTPEVDDDLALTYGFKTIDVWKTKIRVDSERRLKENQDNLVDINTMATLVNPETVDVEPIPFHWMTTKAKEIYGALRKNCPTEEDVVKRFNGARTTAGEEVKDKNTVLTFLGEKSAQSLIHDLVLRSWGRQAGVEGDSALSNIDEYVVKVKAKLDSLVKVEEFEIGKPQAQEQSNADVPVQVQSSGV